MIRISGDEAEMRFCGPCSVKDIYIMRMAAEETQQKSRLPTHFSIDSRSLAPTLSPNENTN
jgi:hypothetical protein